MRNSSPNQSLAQRLANRVRPRRVPVLLQMTTTECGAACLAMVLSYFGRRTRVSECSDSLGASRDGLSAHTLAQGARKYGLRVKAYSLEPAALEHLALPAIAHWAFNHFVVVERWSPKRVDIIDPGCGRRRLSPEEFDKEFTGVVLAFEPEEKFERCQAASRPALLHYFQKMLRIPGASALLGQVLGVSALLQVLGLVMPLFTKVMVDKVLPLHLNTILPIVGLGMFITVLAEVIGSYLRSTLLIRLEVRLDSKVMLGFFEHVLALPFRFFQQRTTGDLLMRLGSNTIIREMLSSQTVSLILDGAFVVVYLVLLMALAPIYCATVLVIGLLYVGVLLASRRRTQELVARDLAASSESQSSLVEALSGIATLKACGAEERAIEHWSNLFYKSLNASLDKKQLSAALDTAMNLLRMLSPMVFLWLGASQVLRGSMSVGTMFALSALAMSALSPLASLAGTAQQLQMVGAHLDRIADVLEAKTEQDPAEVPNAPALSGQIELRNAGFRYDPNSPWVLRNVSFSVRPGQKIALVGRSGSGKSTLAKLLLGLYAPVEGQVLYDDIPLAELNLRSVRRQLGVVMQESFLFSGSIRQNIAFHDPGLSMERIGEAARSAAIEEDIAAMPMGYETRLAEGGSGLSGGQRQRLSLARALAQRPPVLVLDEATSHLDVVSEAAVERSLSELACTRIVIAHRLSTVRDADVILVLDQGRLVEQGTHEELMAEGGFYAELVSSQLEKAPAEEVGAALAF